MFITKPLWFYPIFKYQEMYILKYLWFVKDSAFLYFFCVDLDDGQEIIYSEYFFFQVSFLNQENIISTIQNAVETKLMNSNSMRTFNTQVIFPK